MSQSRNIKLTVVGLLVFIIVDCRRIRTSNFTAAGDDRIGNENQWPVFARYPAEASANLSWSTTMGVPFNRARLKGKWSLVFFGFTYCPDICPTTMTFLNEFMASLEGTEAQDTQVVMVSVDPARDTVQQLAGYVPFFNPDFIGVTGEFLDIHRVATALNTPFRKVMGEGDNYQVDHSANIVLINPRGDYHGFFKAPLDLAKMKTTYRSARVLWEQ